GPSGDVVRVGDDAGHDDDDGVVTANRRDRLEDLVADHGLAPGTLYVHDRALAGDGDRLRQAANLEIHVDRRREGAGQLDAFTLEGAEPGERVGGRVGTWPQIFDPILTRSVGDRRADFLDERRARGLHGYSRENSPGGVADHA